MISRRRLMGAAAVSAIGATGVAQAQSNVLRIVVPLTAGTTPDTVGRAMGPHLQQRLRLACLVDNRPGASGLIGMKYVAQSTDQATIMLVPATTVTLPFFYKEVGFDVVNGFAPITQVVSSSFVLAVNKAVPASNLDEFIRWAKATPGAFYGSPGNGTHHHLFMELLLQTLGLKIEHVAYAGTAPAVNDLLGGQIPTMFLPIQVAVPLRDAGRIKIIGGSLRDRHPGFKDIPSLQEQGAKGYHADPWFAAWGTPRMPPDVVETYRQAIVAALEEPATHETLTKQGLIIKTGTPDELHKKTAAEAVLWGDMVRKSGRKFT
jgi:tripartite-type tricarboxylate transporter receptor subunit TctC